MLDTQTLLAVLAAAPIGATATGWAVLVNVQRHRRRAQLVDEDRYTGRHRPPAQRVDADVDADVDAFRLAELSTPPARRQATGHRYAWPTQTLPAAERG